MKGPSRTHWQMHLSTAVVLMFVAGGLIWANVRERSVDVVGEAFRIDGSIAPHESTETKFIQSKTDEIEGWAGDKISLYGWPCDGMHSSSRVYLYKNELYNEPHNEDRLRTSVDWDRWFWHPGAIVANALIALGILFAVGFGCELWIRWRGAPK